MKKYIAFVACALVSAAVAYGQGPNPANGSLIFTDSVTNQTSGTYAAGSSFTLNVSLQYGGSAPANANGISFWLEALTSLNTSAPDVFTITAPTAGTTWTDPQTSPFLSDPINGSAGNSEDLGWSGDAVSSAQTFSLGTLTISIASNASGSFVLSNLTTDENFAHGAVLSGDSTVGNLAGVFDLPNTDFDVNVTAVPEPSTWFAGIGALGVIGYSMIRRRRIA
jgi:hypothetical protein